MPFGFDKPHSWLRDDDEFDRYNKPGSSDWFSLSDDVSWTKPNNRHDGIKVESLLGYGGYLDLEKGGGPLGLSNRKLEEPIKTFQEKNGLKVDGLLKPGGPTITKMKALYGGVFGKTPAPTPAMMDAHAQRLHDGEDGFLYDKAPKFELKPNRRLDGKAHLMEYERWNRDWARNSGDNAPSLAPEYERYIRDLDKDHGHDPGLIFARDITKQVENYHGTGGDLAKRLVTLLSDRPDLQREFLGGPIPTSPPIGTFKDGGEAGVKAWIDEDRVANGLKPKFTTHAAQDDAPVLRISSGAQPAPDPKNLIEYIQNFGPLEPEPPQQAAQMPAPGEGGAGWYDPNEMTPAPRPPAKPRDGSVGARPAITVPLPPLEPPEPAAAPVAPEDEANPTGPISGARFTEGIVTERRQPVEPFPPPPAPVPPRPPQATRTENAWIVENRGAVLDRARASGGWLGVLPNGQPSRECVGLVQEAVPGIGHTSTWRQGDRVQPPDPERPVIAPGTPIATFDGNGRYPNRRTGNHAGIFDSYGEDEGRAGIWVIDQYNEEGDGEARRRFYPFDRAPGHRGYRAGDFSVIRPNNANRR